MPTDKELKNLSLEDSPQLALFELLESNNLSNTIEIYDALPKFLWDARRHKNIDEAIITKECSINGVKFKLNIEPAMLAGEDGQRVFVYAGAREELVEEALRKLAVSGQGRIIAGKAGVVFTLYELQKELESRGHTYSINEVKEAILIMRKSNLEIISQDNQDSISANYFPMVGLTTRKKWKEEGGVAKCYVQFNPMVNESIMQMTFRQYNYQLSMAIRSPLARFIYKRMSHQWTQAHETKPYTPKLMSFLKQSPRRMSQRMSENLRAMRNALDSLIRYEVVQDYDEILEKKGRKITDAKYVIRPHPNFVKQAIKANRQKAKVRQVAIEQGIIHHDVMEDEKSS